MIRIKFSKVFGAKILTHMIKMDLQLVKFLPLWVG